uniref:Uncharacterized protein n=1 Tax=Glossina austeni TaxID=7395 RepID=A0A1A9USK4_GLOAU
MFDMVLLIQPPTKLLQHFSWVLPLSIFSLLGTISFSDIQQHNCCCCEYKIGQRTLSSNLTTKATLIRDNHRLTLFAVGVQQHKFEEAKDSNSERNAQEKEFRFGLRISSQTDGIESAYNSIIREQLMTV